jgi:hypothetical protein
MSEPAATAVLNGADELDQVHEPAYAAPAGKKYLYAIVGSDPELRYDSIGIGGAAVYTITERRLSAVVGDVEGPSLRPERRNLAAHQEVLRRLMGRTTTLPFSFGTVAGGPAAVRKFLARNQHALLENIERLSGKAEMGVRLSWDVPNIFEYFIDTHTELRAARDQLFSAQYEPTQAERLEIGRLFESMLQDDREAFTGQVEAVLSPCCAEIKSNKCRHEREVMNLACLVEGDQQAAFEKAVLAVAQLFDNNFSLDYSGPWPPFNFVRVNLKV